MPQSCASLNILCGRATDGCQGPLDCGACDPPLPPTDAGTLCTSVTCADLGKNCGRMLDACGYVTDCGRCSGTDVCGRPGLPNVCVPCSQMSDVEFCAAHDARCGVVSDFDNCNQRRDVACGTCNGPEVCGGTGRANQCGCPRPTTREVCLAVNATCGTISTTDRCGTRTDYCGSCTSYQVCGANGAPNTCSCVLDAPAVCADAGVACGPLTAKDECYVAHTISCGSCALPQTCGGGGAPGRCGVCVPEGDAQLCARARKDCGAIALTDNCGAARTPSCGNCAPPRTCGGLLPNVCSPDPLCTTDVLPATDGGSMEFGQSWGFTPLCGAEVVIGNADTNEIEILDLAGGLLRARYPLTARPNRMVLDRSHGLLHVGLLGASEYAIVDLVDAGTRYVPLPAVVSDLALGNDGQVFVALVSATPSLAVVDAPSGSVIKTFQLPTAASDLVAFNHSASQVILADAWGAVLYRYAFDPQALTLTLLEIGGSGINCDHLEISPDDAHLALSCGHGNDFGYRSLDWNPTDLRMTFGSWDVGAYPSAGHFSRDSRRFVSTNALDRVDVFGVANHARLASFSTDGLLFRCSYIDVGHAGISAGGQVVFALTTCGFNRDSSVLTWWVLP